MSEPAARTAFIDYRYWCPIAETHQPLEDGANCNWSDCIAGKATHTLRKRKMLVCSVCSQCEFTQTNFDEHECFSAY